MAQGRKGSTPGPDATVLAALNETIRVLRMGQPVTVACSFAGITKATFHKWLRVGNARPVGDQLRAFADEVAKAREAAKVMALGSVFKGMQKDWKAAAWFLGVTKPAEFGQRVRVTLEEEFTGAIENLESDFADDPQLLGKILASITRRRSGTGNGPPGVEEPGAQPGTDPEPA